MTAKEIMTPSGEKTVATGLKTIAADMPLTEILPRLLDSPGTVLSVSEEGEHIGIIDRDSFLDGLGRLLPARDDCSVIMLECRAEDYSASRISHAVEDSDAHLVDLISTPGDDGIMSVTLRVSHRDPGATVRSLERYDFKVTAAYGNDSDMNDPELSAERLLSLRVLMNV